MELWLSCQQNAFREQMSHPVYLALKMRSWGIPLVVHSLEWYELPSLNGGDVDVNSFASQCRAHLALLGGKSIHHRKHDHSHIMKLSYLIEIGAVEPRHRGVDGPVRARHSPATHHGEEGGAGEQPAMSHIAIACNALFAMRFSFHCQLSGQKSRPSDATTYAVLIRFFCID